MQVNTGGIAATITNGVFRLWYYPPISDVDATSFDAFNDHVQDGSIHVTQGDKDAWNGYAPRLQSLEAGPVVESITDPAGNYFIRASKYADGWLSAYGWIINAGIDAGIQVPLPSGMAFVDTNYGLSGMSMAAESGGAIDSLKCINQQTDSFTLQTSHLESGLVLEYTQEKFSFIASGHWK
jgi:hypothetical protein